MKLREIVVLIAICIITWSCAAGGESENENEGNEEQHTDLGVMPEGDVTHYEKITSGSGASLVKAIGLCDLVHNLFMGEAGLYEVKDIVGVAELPEGCPECSFDGFTYVDLELVAPWVYGAAENVVVRISGGPAGNGILRAWNIDLEIGETIGAIFVEPKNNKGYLGLLSFGVFKENTSGGYSNGLVFTQESVAAEALGMVVGEIAVAKNDECPFDAEPDYGANASKSELTKEGSPVDANPEEVEP